MPTPRDVNHRAAELQLPMLTLAHDPPPGIFTLDRARLQEYRPASPTFDIALDAAVPAVAPWAEEQPERRIMAPIAAWNDLPERDAGSSRGIDLGHVLSIAITVSIAALVLVTAVSAARSGTEGTAVDTPRSGAAVQATARQDEPTGGDEKPSTPR